MTRVERPVLREGVVAGVIGAAVVAVWFLVFDVLRGRPLLTPTILGTTVFQGAPAEQVALGPILGYTLLHGLAFIAFGVVAASLVAASEREPPLVVAVVILFACFETLFLGVATALGDSVAGALVWWAILIGNLFAAIAMLWYFLRRHRTLPRILVGSWAGVLREGIVAGLAGAAAVAMWFLLIDAMRGDPFRTPRLLATALLRVPADAPAVLLYTVFHGLAFALFGIVVAVLIAGAEREPMFVFALVILFTAFEVLFFGAVIIVAKWVLDEVAGWTIFAGNLLAAGAMLTYFFKGHRALARRVTGTWPDDD